MSEFEKWWNINQDKYYFSEYRVAEKSWKAALEWAYNMFTGDWHLPYNAIGYEIGKELEELGK